MFRTLKASKWFTPYFPLVSLLFCLPFGCRSKHHNHCNIHLKSESITSQLWKSNYHDKTSGQFSENCFCIKNEPVLEFFCWTPFVNSVHEDCAHIRTGLRPNCRAQYKKLVPRSTFCAAADFRTSSDKRPPWNKKKKESYYAEGCVQIRL